MEPFYPITTFSTDFFHRISLWKTARQGHDSTHQPVLLVLHQLESLSSDGSPQSHDIHIPFSLFAQMFLSYKEPCYLTRAVYSPASDPVKAAVSDKVMPLGDM